MGRSLAVTVAVGLLVVACSGDGEVASTTTIGEEPAGSSTAIDPRSDAGGSTSTFADPGATTTTEGPDGDQRPLAPDFTLNLGTGGTYTLSETDNPVYLVFWAEW